MKRQKETPGSIIRVKIDVDSYVYGRVLNFGDVAFYDCMTQDSEKPLEEVISLPIIFKGFVNDNAVKKGRWPIVGFRPLEGELRNSKYFLEEIGNPNLFKVIENGQLKYGYSKEDCHGLPFGGVWDPEGIEEILRDHFESRESPLIKMYYAVFNT